MSPSTDTHTITFEPEFIEAFRNLFEEQIVFNRVMGPRLVEVLPHRLSARIDMRPELVGHFMHGRMHGGVISACLDALGGLACVAALAARHMDEPPLQRMLRFDKLGTIDLRIDYLRPAVSDSFHMHAEVMRLGSRVGSTRMEFHAANGLLLATGAAAYMVA